MQFESLAAFIDMAGHGRYVWLAYGVSFAVVLALVLHPVLKRRRLQKALRLVAMMEQDYAPKA